MCNISDDNNVDSGTWLQYDFSEVRRITGVRTQGRIGISQWVTSYQLQGWQDSAWVTVADESGNPIVSQLI